jgi:transcriptional regulator
VDTSRWHAASDHGWRILRARCCNLHIQPIFAENDTHTLHQLIRAYPLATVITVAPHGLEVNLLPLEISSIGELGRLSGHASRNHDLFKKTANGSDVTVLFQSPNAYISPHWYVNGQRSSRNAPSWNYVAVQARGCVRFIDNAVWLAAHLAALTSSQESGRDNAWSMQHASAEFIHSVSQGLMGFEIDITELIGKIFLSQQRTPADRDKLVHHLKLEPNGAAHDLAALIKV